MKKRVLFVIILALVANGLALAGFAILQSLWGVIITLGGIAIGMCSLFLRVRSVRKRRVRYPLVPPEGKPDMYLPRTDIPRPVIEDYRKIEEKRRRFAKIRELVRKKLRRRKN